MRVLLYLLAVWICECGNALAQEPSRPLQLTIGFDGAVPEGPTPFVFIKGELAGAVPGTMAIPETRDDVAVEVGIAQLSPAPLYSFAVGPKSLAEGSVEVTMSEFNRDAPGGDGVWRGLGLGPNTRSVIKVEPKEPGSYSILLPAKIFRTVAEFWASRTSDFPKDRNWFGTIGKSRDASTASGLDHLSFDKRRNQSVLLASKGDQAWSGAYATFSGVLNGYDLPTQQWTIVSNPAGASIYTEAGAQGSTTSTISIAQTSSWFVVLKKDGYLQCASKDCQRQNSPQGVTLICNLKKAR